MIGVTLKQLRYFDALAREQHFGRAAEACAVSQPALSMQIQELEALLGTVLVERTRGGVRLTPTGAKIAERAARILNDTRDLVDIAQHGDRLLSGTLRLGVIPSIAPYLLPPLLSLVQKHHSQLELHIRETQTDPLTEELIKGQIDVMLLALPVDHAEVETLQLFEDPFLLALPKGRKLTGRVKATPDLIKNERLLLLEEGHCLRDQALSYCSLQKVEAINAFGASSLATIAEMVAAGLGITLLPEICQRVEAHSRGITLMRFVDPQPSRILGLAWRKTSPRSRDFIELGRLLTLAWQDLVQSFDDVSDNPDVASQKRPSRKQTAKKKIT